jgi:hypothetical protein
MRAERSAGYCARTADGRPVHEGGFGEQVAKGHVACVLPSDVVGGDQEGYEEVCARIGVEPRSEGWALWNTWSGGELKVTMVVSAVETTEGLFQNWSRGRVIDPVAPLPSQIALVRRDWIGPMTFSPRAVSRMGLNGEPLSWTIDSKGSWS